MKEVNEFIGEFLEHVYDPKKAHEYYERTKKLKGRKRGTSSTYATRVTAPSANTRTRAAAVATSGGKAPAKKTAGADARVAAIQARLDRLKEVLAELVAQAKGRAGVEPESNTKKKTESSKDSKPEKKTAAEKKKDAKAAKERRDKEAKLSPDQRVAAIQKEMQQVREQIADIRARMAAAAKRTPPRASSSAGSEKNQTPGNRPQAAVPGRHH